MRTSAFGYEPHGDEVSVAHYEVTEPPCARSSPGVVELARRLWDALRDGALGHDSGSEEVVSSSTATVELLLPGEARESDVLEDAEHWTAVYEELTHFLLDSCDARSEMTGRFRSRLEYWRHRRDELTR